MKLRLVAAVAAVLGVVAASAVTPAPALATVDHAPAPSVASDVAERPSGVPANAKRIKLAPMDHDDCSWAYMWLEGRTIQVAGQAKNDCDSTWSVTVSLSRKAPSDLIYLQKHTVTKNFSHDQIRFSYPCTAGRWNWLAKTTVLFLAGGTSPSTEYFYQTYTC